MYQALYRKWRPQSFSDVVGQEAICDTLTRQIETGHTSHAYLFSGSRGTGKTSCAKILAKAINCENPFHGNPCNKCPSCLGITSGEILDIVEIDAASNNGVDHVRDLRDEAIYTPANVKKRVYIIDEVHMFSSSAFNALLKIMEEPPAHVVFILATTELHKVPATIASRCQRFIFKRIPLSAISERLKFIARHEGSQLSDVAADYIASISDGAMRDALSLLDQCISMSGETVSEETVEDVVGLAGRKQTFDLAEAIAKCNSGDALSLLNQIYAGGKNLNSVLNELSDIFRDILILKAADGKEIPQISARYSSGELMSLAGFFDTFRLCSVIETLRDTTSAIAMSANKRIDAEICCVRLCENAASENLSSLTAKVNELSEKLRNGSFAPAAVSSAPVAKKETPKPASDPFADVPFEVDAPPKEVAAERPSAPKPAPAAPKPKPQASPSGADDMWAKILSRAKPKLSPGVSPLFSTVSAEFSDNILTLTSENTFVMQMLKKSENINILREAANEISPGIILTAGGISVEVPETSGMDELLEGLGDFDEITIK